MAQFSPVARGGQNQASMRASNLVSRPIDDLEAMPGGMQGWLRGPATALICCLSADYRCRWRGLGSSTVNRMVTGSSPARGARSFHQLGTVLGDRISTSPRFELSKASSTCSSPSTERRSSPSSRCTQKVARRTAGDLLRRMIAAVPIRSIPFSPTMEPTSPRQAIRARRLRTSRPPWRLESSFGRTPSICLRPERHRSSADKAQASMDQWTSRKNEPHHQGRDRQTLLLRDPRPAANPPARFRRRLDRTSRQILHPLYTR